MISVNAAAMHHDPTLPPMQPPGPQLPKPIGAATGKHVMTDSIAFTAGQQYERRRIGELLRQRIADLNSLAQCGLPARTVKALTAEVQLLITAIEKDAA